MTVKELIEQLQTCNPNAEVIGYTDTGEQDFVIYDVEPIIIRSNDPDRDEKIAYCGGWSVVEEEFLDKPIVYLKG